MAHFRIELDGQSVEFKKTDSMAVEHELCSIGQLGLAAKFFVKGKEVSMDGMWAEINAIKDAWLERRSKTHKQISVIDGVSGFKRKLIWVRR